MSDDKVKRYNIKGARCTDTLWTFAPTDMVLATDFDAQVQITARIASERASLEVENRLLQQRYDALAKAADALAAKYEEAIGDLSDWGAYVSEYFQVKHGFTKCVTGHVEWLAAYRSAKAGLSEEKP